MIVFTTATTVSQMLDTVLLKTASRCNLDCTYCYVYRGADTSWKEQPYHMSDTTIKKIIERLSEYSTYQSAGFAIVLHGGEPLLLGYKRLVSLLTGLRNYLIPEKYPISIQTNGALISDKILELCEENQVSISVSIDGSRKANDIARFTRSGKSSFNEVVAGIKKLSSHPNSKFLFAGTLSVVHPNINPQDTYNYLKKLNTPSMDFLFQDGNHDKLPVGKRGFVSTEYGNWLHSIFLLYINDPSPVPIKILDDIIKILLGGTPSKEGKGENYFGILVIESDGEIRKNDTLRASFEGVDYFINRPNIYNSSISDVINTDEFKKYTKTSMPISETCKSCEHIHVCGGGMPLYRWSKENGFNNPSVYCEDHKVVINEIKKYLIDNSLISEQ